MDLKGITGGSGHPSVEIFNENNSPIVITTIGTGNSLNSVSVPAQTYQVVQTGLNWSAVPIVTEINIMVKINETTYRWYTLKWLGMQASSSHAIFLSAIRVA